MRILLFEFLLLEFNEKGELIEEIVNFVEYYLRRIGLILVWIGDIFK